MEAAPCQTQSVLLWCCCEAEQSPHSMPGSAGTALPSLLAHALILPLAPRDTMACGRARQSNIRACASPSIPTPRNRWFGEKSPPERAREVVGTPLVQAQPAREHLQQLLVDHFKLPVLLQRVICLDAASFLEIRGQLFYLVPFSQILRKESPERSFEHQGPEQSTRALLAARLSPIGS